MASHAQRVQGLWQAMRGDLDASVPDIGYYPLPEPAYQGEIGDGLYDSDRDYLEQLEAYKVFQGRAS